MLVLYLHPTNIEPNRYQMLEDDSATKVSTAIAFEVTCDREETAAEKSFSFVLKHFLLSDA